MHNKVCLSHILRMFTLLIVGGVGLALFCSCASTSLEEGQMEIKKVVVLADKESIDTKLLRNYVRQRPGLDSGKKMHPVYDTLQTRLSCEDLATVLKNKGYLYAHVDATCAIKEKTRNRRNPQCYVIYYAHTGEPYHLRKVSYQFNDEHIDSLMMANMHERETYLKEGNQFSVEDLNAERNSITKLLQNRGYYRFNKDFIRYIADTIPGDRGIDLTLLLMPYRVSENAPEEEHPFYTIRKINYISSIGDMPLRQSVLNMSTSLHEGQPYSAAALQDTYRRFGRMQTLRYTNIRFTELPDSVALNALDCDVHLSARKPNSISFQPEGTNTAGDLGAAASLTYENRNLFRGSENFSVRLRGAYEAITGLEGYNNKDYVEYAIESKLQFPRFIAPFLSRKFRHDNPATSEFALSYNLQNRPEFHRRVFSAAWRYNWSEAKHHTNYKLDLLDLNYIYMPWISETFKHEYLDSVSNRNAILRYNYEDLFVMKIGFGLAYSNKHNALKFNIETAGNLLNAMSHLCSFRKNDDGQYTLFNIAYAQYVKMDIDATHMIKLAPRTEFVLHGGLGVAYPYGNSKILPFEKRYFSGGANSVRGWSVRGLGPGSFSGSDGRIDFINQTGDIKLDLNMEYRTHLFWKVFGAAFIDAGNIWTIREYENQPGGQFRLEKFLKQLAVAYGLGVRFNFDYFILRFDCGMKAVNPMYDTTKEHYPIVHPRLSRDFDFHFAVGLPF